MPYLGSASAEAEVLGFCLSARDPLSQLSEVGVVPEDFSLRHHMLLFRGIRLAVAPGEHVNVFALEAQFENEEWFKARHGTRWLDQLRESCHDREQALHAARAMRLLARRRILCEGFQRASYAAADLKKPTDAAHDEARKATAEASRLGTMRRAESAAELLPGYLRELEALAEGEAGQGLSSPFPELDKLTSGFAPGEVVILAGRPGTGKTALALNMAAHAASRGRGVGVFSLEMRVPLLLNRLCAAEAEVDAQRFRSGELSEEDWRRIRAWGEGFSARPLYFSDQSRLTPARLKDRLTAWRHESGLDFAVIDYLQLLTPEARGQSREREVAEVSRQIKVTAMELEMPILLLAQLNREAEKTRRPLLSHLRESGAVEQDADIILFLRPWNTTDQAKNVIVDLDVAKGRNNATGTVQLLYRRRFTRFEAMPGTGGDNIGRGLAGVGRQPVTSGRARTGGEDLRGHS